MNLPDPYRRRTLGAIAALPAAAAPGALRAEDAPFPSRPIRIVVPFTPGGSSDILARVVGKILGDAWPAQPTVIDNRPGAGGAIGAEAVARATPDGSTLLMGHIGTLAVNPTLYPRLRYDPVADFAPVALVAMVPNVLVVHPSVPARSLAELVALAKSQPGRLGYASGGAGSAAHLAMEYFKLATGTDIVHVPYKGTAPALTDLVGGQVAMTMTGVPPLLSYLRGDRLRALAVASAGRLSQLPAVPTAAEAGLAGFEATQWYGIVAPVRTPAAIVEQLSVQIRRGLAGAEQRARLEGEGAVPRDLTAEGFGQLIRDEITRWAQVIRAARIEV